MKQRHTTPNGPQLDIQKVDRRGPEEHQNYHFYQWETNVYGLWEGMWDNGHAMSVHVAASEGLAALRDQARNIIAEGC